MADHTGETLVPGWLHARVSAVFHWTDNLFSLRLATRIDGFEAGQYTFLALPETGQTTDAAVLDAIAQPYSILSAPAADELEFFFYTQLEGDLSRRLSRLQPGDRLWVRQRAEGTLTLSRVASASTLWLLATGTGVAPFVSMLGSNDIWQKFDTVVLVYAVRQWQDLRYRELFADLAARYGDRFRLIPVVSREIVSREIVCREVVSRTTVAQTSYPVIHGHIPASLGSGELEQAAGRMLSADNSQVMLCGNPGMVKDAIQVLQARGLRDNKPAGSGQLTYEAYW